MSQSTRVRRLPTAEHRSIEPAEPKSCWGCRVTANDRGRGDNPADYGSEGHDGCLAHPGAWGQHGAGADPDIGSDRDRPQPQAEIRRAEVMVAGAQVSALGEADPIPQGDTGKVVNPDIFTKPAMVAATQPPGKLDPQSWLEAAALPKSAAKTT